LRGGEPNGKSKQQADIKGCGKQSLFRLKGWKNKRQQQIRCSQCPIPDQALAEKEVGNN